LRNLSDVFRLLAEEPYEPRGIVHSEMALVLAECQRLHIDIVIESGRARGQSTYILGKYLPWVEVHSIELRCGPDEEFAQRRLAGLKNVTLYEDDSVVLIPTLARMKKRRTAILLDGPKGEKAVSILEQCFKLPHVLVGFIHDMRRLDHGAPSPHRACAVERLPKHRFSDDPAYVAGTSWMDAKVAEAGGPVGPQFEAVHGSYGPTIGAFFNPQTKI
jgi:hypothetical protein